MKKLGLYLMAILAVCLSFMLGACSLFNSTEPAKDKITLSETAITLEVGASQTLTATTNVQNGVEWSTSNASIATVEEGVVTALAVGEATITAKAGSATATCIVTVNESQEYAELLVDKTDVELKEGGASISVTATFIVNDEIRPGDFVWTSENEAIATVEDGNILPVSVGSTVVTVSIVYKGETYAADVNVAVKPDEQIQVSKGTIELELVEINGGIISDTFTATAYNAGVENTEVALEYVSSNEEVATVTAEAGVATVTSVGEGTCTISVSYVSTYGKIETIVTVIVTRSTLVLEGMIEIPYVAGNTVLDLSVLELQGTLDGVYFEDEKVASADGVLNADFVEKNKDVIIPIEVRTSVAIYETELFIAVPYAAKPQQETAPNELVDMPTFDGDATTLGFPAGTETAYELVIDKKNGKDGWTNRMITNVARDKDVVVFDVIIKEAAESSLAFTVWTAKNTLETQGSYSVSAGKTTPNVNEGADPNRTVFVLGTDGERPASLSAGTLCTVYVFLMKGETHVHFSTFTDAKLYIANIRCEDAEDVPEKPEERPDDGGGSGPVTPPVVDVPDYVMQGDSTDPKAAYEGDVTALGFTAGTTVYAIENNQEEQWADCWNTRLSFPLEGTQSSVAIEFIATKEFAFDEILSVWGTAGVPHMGTINKTGIAGDWAIITDVDGNILNEVNANTLYVLHIACAEYKQVQVGVLGKNLVYIGNVTCSEEDIPIYEAPTVMQGDGRMPMPEYDGNATDLGFAEGTDVVYELIVDAANGKDGWTNRTVLKVDEDKDVVVFDVIVTEIASADFRFTMWPEIDGQTLGSYELTAKTADPSADADLDRKIFILGTDGKRPSSLTTGTLYTVYFFLNEGETHVHFSTFTDGKVHIANIRCINADEVENDPTLPPPPISQGEARNEMPIFDGDVTTLGFEAGTTVYQIVGPQGDANDVKLVAQVDASGDMAYAKLDFVVSANTGSIGLWITGINSHLGYYTVTPTGFTTDGRGDPARSIFVTDANGASVTAFEANKVYTLYVGLDGREATIQVTTWADLTMYVANVACISDSELPFDDPRPPVVQGKEISILFIGNSFSDDTEAYMIDILLNLGYTNIDIGNLYIGGCSIDLHYENITGGGGAYDFRMRSHNGRKYTEYAPVTVGGTKKSLDFAIAYKDWDIISVQQASGYSGNADSYANLDALVEEVKKQVTNPDVEFVFNMTWAYQADSTHAQFPDYNSDQMTMYNAIVGAVQSKVTYTVVPNGTAIQNARTSFIGDTLTRDGYHLNLQIGRYIAGLTFVAKVTGADITDFAYAPNGVTKAQLAVAIESIQNALATPFAVTESEIKNDPYAIDPDSDITAGGLNTDAVMIYNGNVEDLGFAAGSEVFKYVGVDSAADKVAIKADSTNYDFVDVQFVIGSGDGYFFAYVCKNGVFLNGGSSYVIDPSDLRLIDGSALDRKIQVFDASGNIVSTLMSTNTLYTLRVYIKAGEIDQVMIGKNGSTIYLANVTHGLIADLPVEGPIKQGEGQAALPAYDGDETAHGFEEGTFLQYMVTETMSNAWGTEPTSGKTREALAARIPGEAGKYVTVKFAVSEDIESGSVFYVWGLLGSTHTKNGSLNFTATTYGRILDVNGYPVASLAKNTVYVLELYIEGTDTYKVSNICGTGMELYFAPDSITCSDKSIAVQLPGADSPITAGGSNIGAVTVYEGDETALGFAEGTTVYQYVGVDSSTDKAAIKVDSTNYDYVEVEFVIAEGDGYFFMHGLKGGNWHNSGTSYVIDPSWIRLADGNNSDSDRTIEIFDADGNKVTSQMANNVVYTLRVYIKVGELDEIRISKNGSTIYLANVTHGVDAGGSTPDPDPTPVPDAPIVSGETTSTALTVYDGDATTLGFEEGTTVYELTSVSSWDDRVKIATDPSYKYLDVDFVVTSGAWYFNVWVCDASGFLDGSYLVAELGGGTQHATFGDGFAKHTPNTGASGGNTRIQVLDADGNVVIGGRTNGTVYTLRVWLDEEDVTSVQIGQDNVTMYFANIECTDKEPLRMIKQGDGATTLPTYEGDVTAHGFEEGTLVQYMVTETLTGGWWESTSVDSNGKTREALAARIPDEAGKYVTVKFATSEDIASGSVFYVWGLLGSTYTKNGGLNFTDTTYGRILDLEGYPVTSLAKNTVYVLELYIEETDTYKVANICGTGMELYFATESITYSDKSVAVQLPGADSPITAGGTNTTAVIYYTGDETALGFAENTTVYQYVGVNSVADKAAIKVDSTNYDYVDVQFVIGSGDGYFFAYALKGGSFLNSGSSYVIDPSNLRLANGSAMDRTIEVLDANGNAVSTLLSTNTLYTLRVYIKAGEVDQVMIAKNGSTIYLANVTHGIDVSTTAVDIKIGDSKADPTLFDGDETAYGFADGTEVAVMTLEATTDVDDKRLALEVDSSKKYLAIDFALEFGLLGNIYVWTVTDGGERVLAATILAEGGVEAGALVDIVIKDSNGNDVTSEVLVGLDSGAAEKYTLYVYYDGADEVHIGCDDYDEEGGGNILYFADAECRNVEA